MRINTKIFLLLPLFFLLVLAGNSQTYEEILAKSANGVDISDKLPSLAELQQIAIEHSPVLNILNADVRIGEYTVKQEQRKWMADLGFEGGARYGLFDNLLVSNSFGNLESKLATTEETRYYIGAFLKIPIADIFDKSNVKTAKAENEKLIYQREASIKELRQLIILRYNEVIKAFRKVIINTNSVETYRMQMIRAKVDFNNGKINIAEYARLDYMLSKALVDLEDAKLDYSSAFQILEETVGVKIKLKE